MKATFKKLFAWDNFDFTMGALLSAVVVTSGYAIYGGARFREVALAVTPFVAPLTMLLVIWFCVANAMSLMGKRKEPLLSPEKVKGLSLAQIIAIGVFGNLGSISLFAIAFLVSGVGSFIMLAVYDPATTDALIQVLIHEAGEE